MQSTSSLSNLHVSDEFEEAKAEWIGESERWTTQPFTSFASSTHPNPAQISLEAYKLRETTRTPFEEHGHSVHRAGHVRQVRRPGKLVGGFGQLPNIEVGNSKHRFKSSSTSLL
jgi:hypothetical protein